MVYSEPFSANENEKLLLKSLLFYPTPNTISYSWNLGSLLGFILVSQIITGFMLTVFYTNAIESSFISLQNILSNTGWSFFIQTLHLNGASLFFLVIYLHVLNGIIINSYNLKLVWAVGSSILLLSIIIAFLGYVLPFGNISLWAATVITNLIGVIPFFGSEVVVWVWGGFFLSNSALNLFFSLHFLVPLLLVVVVLLHLFFLHITGSNTNLGSSGYESPLGFSLFLINDLTNFVVLLLLVLFSTLTPYFLSDPDSYIPSNPLISPLHIMPEWYFLFAYAILRSIPNNLGGVVALVISVVGLFFLVFSTNNFLSNQSWTISLSITIIFMVLTFIGINSVEEPFVLIGQTFSALYFIVLGLFVI